MSYAYDKLNLGALQHKLFKLRLSNFRQWHRQVRMVFKRFVREGRQIIIHTEGGICQTKDELLSSDVFEMAVGMYIDELSIRGSPALKTIFGTIGLSGSVGKLALIGLLREVARDSLEAVALSRPAARALVDTHVRDVLHGFVLGLYDYWRSFDRFMLLSAEMGASDFDQRPYRVFNNTIETLTNGIRSLYRDICENVTGDHPRVYRQVAAGCNVGLIAIKNECRLPRSYDDVLGDIPFIRQMWFDPPMVIDPPMNKREGQFKKVEQNPVEGLSLKPNEWICYPAQVGPLVIFVYIHQRFIGLGCALANLFDIADEGQIAKRPEAIYLFGAPPETMAGFGELPAVFHEDTKENILIAAVPGEDRFGYFGYLKKMILTLHNIVMMKRGRMPFHGAMVNLLMKSGAQATVLIIGDTATGKSETLEALRVIGGDSILELRIIADDMGSLDESAGGKIKGYGTEIGAFVRLDDLQRGYAFGQIDRSIIMSPHRTNARVVFPVTTLKEILRGHPVDYLFYANNYECVDAEHPVIERLDSAEAALAVFREGTAMAKGTTSSCGLTRSYFANIFGPPQYMELHDGLAGKIFHRAFDSGTFVGILRTQLGMPGCETSGPEEAAREFLKLISHTN